MSDFDLIRASPTAVVLVDGKSIPVYMANFGAPSAAAALASQIAAEAARADAEGFADDASASATAAAAEVSLAAAQVSLASAQRLLAADEANDAANSAILSAEARDASIAAKNSSETAAGAAGSYLDAIEVLTGGAAISGTLTMQAATRAILTAITGMSAGAQVYLSEAGYTGPFIFVGGNQSAQITADPYKALWLAPDSDTTGASGAWKRIHYGLAQASWAGVIASGIGNYAAQINSLLGHSEVWSVELPAGTVGVSAGIMVPSGKLLFGKGIGASILKATASAGYSSGAPSFTNAVVNLASGSVGSRARDFTINGNKLGSHAIGGVHAIQSKEFMVERVHVMNCTAYAFWAVTNFNFALDVTSGTFRDCWSENSNVSFETTAAQNILFDRCHARDGDGDIPGGIETMFHPISGSKKITYRQCTGISTVGGSVAHVAAYTAHVVDEITFDRCHFEHLADAIALVITSFSARVQNVKIINSELFSNAYFGLHANNITDGIHFSLLGGTIRALAVGINDTPGCSWSLVGTEIVMRHTSEAGTVTPIVGGGDDIVLDGPILDTDRAFNYPQVFPSSNSITVVGAPVIRVPKAGTLPFGKGHKVALVLPVDEDHSVNGTIGAGQIYAFGFNALPAGVYRCRLFGSYQTGATSNALAFAVEGYGAFDLVGSAIIHRNQNGTSPSMKTISSDSTAAQFATANQPVSNANKPMAFEADFTVSGGDGTGGFAVTAGAYLQDGAGYGGTAQVNAGTTLEIEMVA